ncbi:putative leucine-rich repeat receptor-like serine/threonine-protein kinase At2g24130 [Hordeum vulgare subsp. vulgare]|uniref:putative leucine-rich repeat receptor-like serine/threonine-protein kinase At2g24130 n=1 Tax=Hordeum vulgare subsp. vulgare TaxID=112509 RepID=UPI000B47F739|nr:putative leucine-rich repeat receptor-like serine/threonine-protein kinase At2g24130 [Hordeum vulgare subsp. vulgare]
MQELPFSPRNRESLSMPFLGLAALLLLFFASPTNSCTEQENNSLINFLDGLMQDGNGGLNVSWMKGTDCCKWEGIICSSDGTVTDVLLASECLKGVISPSLGNLTGLLHLNLSQNSLEGSLPTILVFSRSIIGLDVSFNHLKGHLQDMQSSNPSLPLQVLNISSNSFT